MKRKVIALLVICVMVLSGCGKTTPEEKSEETVQDIQQKEIADDFEELMEGTRELYEKAAENKLLDSLEFQKQVIDYLGQKGYAAVDMKDQVDMVHSEQVETYCEKAKRGESADVVIYSVIEQGGVVRYELHTDGDDMDAIVSTVRWTDNKPCMIYYHKFKVHSWKYTEKGYFFIEEYHPPGFDGPPGEIGFRVKPLDQKLRELNQKYVLPIGYRLNNMLITNWKEEDYSNLNFYDLYELKYPSIYGKEIPYAMKEGVEYQIPKEEFESVLQTLFPITSEQIQKNAVYNPDTQRYRYRPRGLHDCEFPYEPYSEVISYGELGDGKLKLVVEAVWKIEMLDQAFRSELVVEPLEGGKIHYVSNTILSPEEDEPRWYVPRLTDEQWREAYEKGYHLPIKKEEREKAEKDSIAALKLVQDIYAEADKGDASNVVLTDSVMEQMKKILGRGGVPVISSEEYSVMENYQVMENFLHSSEQGVEGNVILYDILQDGSIERRKYLYDGKEMYLLAVRAVWNEEGDPVIAYRSYTRMKEWRYTEKGWFAYELCVPEPPEVSEIVDGSCMIRVKPLDAECIELSKKCVLPLGYQGNNLLCSNWDREHLEGLDYNGLYEYLYQMKYQKRFVMEEGKNGIPAEEFEQLMSEYLPVTAEQLRNIATFDAEKQEYVWAKLGCGNYAPTHFGTSLPEVIKVEEHQDGALTLTVEAVCDMVISNDAVITHELTVKFREDGSFQYLGNKVLEDGIHQIPQYQYRIAR